MPSHLHKQLQLYVYLNYIHYEVGGESEVHLCVINRVLDAEALEKCRAMWDDLTADMLQRI